MIPLSAPDVSALERAYAADAVASSSLSAGPYLDRFEAAWAARCGTTTAVAVANGTAALTLSLQALGVRPGDEVIVPAFTFAAVAAAVVHAGGSPVAVDVDARTWCLDPDAVAAAVSPRTVGIVAVHGYGQPAPMRPLLELARRHGLFVVEDGAEAHLATLEGRPTGGLGDAGAFSFYGNKIVACGEGGAVTTSDVRLAERIRTLAGHGVPPGAPDRYAPTVLGSNLRLTNVAAALLCAQLDRADGMLQRRRAVETRYRTGLDGLLTWPEPSPGAVPVPWLCTGLLPAGVDRCAVVTALAAVGVQARRTFPAIPDLAPFRSTADVPVARDLARRGISLPTSSTLTEADVRIVCTALREALTPAHSV